GGLFDSRARIATQFESRRLSTNTSVVGAESGVVSQSKEEGTGLLHPVTWLTESHVDLPDTLHPGAVDDLQILGECALQRDGVRLVREHGAGQLLLALSLVRGV